MRHIVICDDEKSMRSQLCAYLRRTEELTGEQFQVTCLSSGEELLTKLPASTDILLLDIQMGAVSGMDAMRSLRQNHPELCVIFITSQVQYALEGYTVHAFGFLKKPLQFGQFRQQLADALAHLDARQGGMLELKADGCIHRLNTRKILYISSDGHVLKVVTQQEVKYYPGKLQEMEEKLAKHGFCRCHKSFLVNFFWIREIRAAEILMQNGELIPLSRHRRKEFMQQFALQAGVTG